MWDLIYDSLIDALMDSAKLIPFLFAIYILLEFIDRKSGTKVYSAIRKAKGFGPLLGGGVGVVPQCGLSAAAATLFSRRVITLGTMIAVFLSASDDMLPICITESVPAGTIVKILLTKLILGVVSGYMVDIVLKLIKQPKNANSGVIAGARPAGIKMMSRKQTEEEVVICTASCCKGNFWIAVIKHTLQVFVFVLAVSVVMNVIIGSLGEEAIGAMFRNIPIVGVFVAALIGLIPNCASSIVITQLYLSGAMSTGAFIGGLLVNAGVGLITLVKLNKDKKENVKIVLVLYCIGVFWGILLELTGIRF